MDEGARAPSEWEIEMGMTLKKIEAASALTEAIINLDVWRVFGANRSSSEFVDKMYSTINRQSLLHEMFRMYSTPSRYGFKNRSTINLQPSSSPSEWNSTIIFSWIDIVLRAWIDATISWSPSLAWVAIMIAGLSWTQCSKRCLAWIPTTIVHAESGLSFVWPLESSFLTDATTSLVTVEDLSSKDEALLVKKDATTTWNINEDLYLKDLIDLPLKSKASFDLVLTADACTSDTAFAELFSEVTGSNANNVKAWRETVGVEDTWTFTAREWTQHDNPPKGQIVEKGTRAVEKLCWLAKRKCAMSCHPP